MILERSLGDLKMRRICRTI